VKNWKEIVVLPDRPIIDVIGLIDKFQTQIALVVDAEGKLSGTITDGDVRRGILRGISLDGPVAGIMNVAPTTIRDGMDQAAALTHMRANNLRQLPVVDAQNVIVDLLSAREISESAYRDNWVVLMAGGMGRRLRPLTDDTPKPMLPIGGKPVLEEIIDGLAKHGFQKFYIAVNYLAEQIESHFGNGQRQSVNIEYLREDMALGTAGALTLLPDNPTKPTIVMNGDLITKVDFSALLDFHAEHDAAATLCVREHLHQVPYGIVTVNGNEVTGLEEKPISRSLINAGIYVLDPGALNYLPTGKRCDMTDLFQALTDASETVVAFPILEYWLDIGQIDDLQRARNDFSGGAA
jgi:dTDP-glucose pyrophosphorylase